MARGSKTGGRQKGTKNKNKEDFFDKALRLGIDPAEYLIKVAGGLMEGDRLTAAKECCRYMYAQKKAIEVESADIKEEVEIINQEVVRLLTEATGRVPS